MVTVRAPFSRRGLLILIAAVCSLILPACGPSAKLSVTPGFKPAPELELVYVVPFESTLVPPRLVELVFDDFVDLLNERRGECGVRRFFILKDDLKSIDREWLSRQVFISGELWSYVENSGCCSTEIRMKARASISEPGRNVPTAQVFVPVETFFDHDRSTLETAQDRIASQLASDLATGVIKALSSPR